ncbi:TetR family transcriptional regulator [Rhodococcus rhodochrous J45]|uniref:TetR family transcriptional regulator n=1 Tax=Rhodococcus rhodochrous J45 TaxID=935266 RepID=A0A562D8G3_RHORH|nr:TetR/AcrR family transcriptional regulator [Rhodococcus rhodochrous]TWH05918.1 TetR family transcriptional regulator [Rhodococcus rhodochrous J45]
MTTKKKRAKARDGEATRQALIDSAAALFAAEGIDAVSVRAINAAAGYGPAATHYHFGSKDAILHAVLLDYGSAVLARIHALASELNDSVEVPSAEEIVRVLAVPYQEFLEEDYVRAEQWLAICGQLSLANDERLFSPMEDDDTAVIIGQLLERAFPDVDKDQRDQNFSLAANTLIAMAATWARAAGGAESASAHRLDSLSIFIAGGLSSLMERRRA